MHEVQSRSPYDRHGLALKGLVCNLTVEEALAAPLVAYGPTNLGRLGASMEAIRRPPWV